MTKYHTLPQLQEEEKKEVVKTVFKKIVGYKYTTGAYIDDTPLTPDRYEMNCTLDMTQCMAMYSNAGIKT